MITLSEKRTTLIIWTLLGLMPIVGMCVDLIAPSLPAISHNLNISTGITKDIISIYLLGYGLGDFFTGLLTDSLGRQKLLRLSLFGFFISSLLPLFAPKIEVLLVARFLQGFTIGSVAVVARAILSDILPTEKLVRMGTLIGAMWGFGPIIGPAIGGYLQFYFGWEATFVFFAIIVAIAFIIAFFVIPETHSNPTAFKLRVVRNNIREILSHQLFVAMAILMGLAYSLIIVFQTSGPFLIQTIMGYTPVFFGNLALVLGVMFLTATFICRSLLKKYETNNLLFAITNSLFAISIIALIISCFFDNNVILIAIISGIMFFGCGFTFPMSMGKGMSLFRHTAGTASAIMYLINILISSSSSFIISFINIHNTIQLFLIYFVILSLIFITYWKMVHKSAE